MEVPKKLPMPCRLKISSPTRFPAYHGTHTLGIMAGGYEGNVTVADGFDGSLPNLIEKPNPFTRMAPVPISVFHAGCLMM